ncbi:MAG: four helix bundle protein [Bacteroidales bacterium]|nr:four helix bundle protein [Bacteroidales bacterium]
MYAKQLQDRTKRFVLEIIRFFQTLPKTDEARIIGKQLLRSSSSSGANYRAACRARSDAEFYSKICIVVEEIDESSFWLEVLTESKICVCELSKQLLKESEELVKIFSSSRKTVKSRLKNQ